MNRFLLPLGIFIVLVAFLAIGLKLDPREVPSPLIGKPAPAFTLPLLHRPEATFAPKDLQGRVWLLNVWASWCVSCRQEHPLLEGRVGIDYGVYGVPETYVIDKVGVIRFKQIGPVTQDVLEKTILPLVKELNE